MSLTEMPRAQWQEFFDRASKALGSRPTQIELTGLGLGDRLAADRAGLVGITYEPRERTLTIAVEGLQHRIEDPKAIHVERDAMHIASIEVVDQDGTHHIVQFGEPLELPAP